ncbi:MAG TPA: ABC transporter ATP-binding protein [Arachidicoccus soli]|nr:ABC transporter ATP-binding protein [Arachidicoccus soli]
MKRKEEGLKNQEGIKNMPKPNIFKVLKPYQGLLFGLLFFALLSNALNLVIPKIIQNGIDNFSKGHFDFKEVILWFSAATAFIFIFSYAETVIQTYASEKVARDLRKKLSDKISRQTYSYIDEANPNILLTNLTSDIDAIKTFVSQAIVSIVSSIVLIIGASILLININWELGLLVILIIPIITISFFVIFRKVKSLFKRSQGILDRLNKIINEAILGSALIRVLNAQFSEYNKFIDASGEAKNIGLAILRLFATLVPIIVFTSNMAVLLVLAMGGHFVIAGTMTLGEFAAFNSYISILIFPILIIGFMSNIIARASASYGRIYQILDAPDTFEGGDFSKELEGQIEVKDITLNFGEKAALKNVSFIVKAHSRTAIIGPTAAGKTQLLYALTTLIKPQEGKIFYDDVAIEKYNQEVLLKQIGLVFQDAIIFNMTLRENIAFNANVTEEAFEKAIDTAELKDFISSLPDGLETIVSERGNSLSGGQKQRIMLARALAGNPKILLLDEFTARVDRNTEQRIWNNVALNYPGITLVSITQNLAPVEDYEQIILLMEGEIVATGKHEDLLKTCPEYIQIYQSQQSMTTYEVEA